VTTARRQLDLAMTEKDWQATIIDLARLYGWLVFHPYDSRRSPPGFPDLCMVRERVVFAELKTQRGRLTLQQADWLDRLRHAGAETHVWLPEDYSEVEQTLRERR
jgi:VRR-NUC domain